MEIFEIYCKIQNGLIFIMRIKTFFLHLKKNNNNKIKDLLKLKLPLHWRSVKKVIRGGITATVGTVATQICLCNKLKTRRST